MGPFLKLWKSISAEELVQVCFVSTGELREAGGVALEEEQKASFGPFSLTDTVPLGSLAQVI